MARIKSILAACALLSSSAAARDIFSPGELSTAHQRLEGLKNCTQCHSAGQQLSPAKCLQCHAEIGATLEKGSGLHGKLAPAQRSCQSCHREHQGRTFAIVDFGEGGAKSFEHTRSGWPLHGAHTKVDCSKCHDARLVQDKTVKKLLQTKQPARTFLGLGTSCTSCHADEHRGQEGEGCLRCHTDQAWKPARGFDHAKAGFALRGAHTSLACNACHKQEPDAAAAAKFPLPVHADSFTRFKPVAHASCIDCHKDPHDNRLGQTCTSCHSESSWKEQKRQEGVGGARAFHQKTAFQLLGAHGNVACKLCHGPFPDGRKVQYKGLAFSTCASCHADAHGGQVQGDCKSCHTEQTFAATSFDLERHLGFPLEGKHAEAKCAVCHVQDASLKSRSKARLRLDGTSCASCHADAHGGKVQSDCRTCHSVQGFAPARYEVEDHQSWPLEGAHQTVACTLCHPKDDALLAKAQRQKRPPHGPWLSRASLVNLHPVAMPATCESCHADAHAGAFKPEGCAACHTVGSFHDAKFDHARTGFPLDGKHASATCAACHGSATRFAKVDVSCVSCHAEPHAGQLGDACVRCHTTESWAPANFHHDEFFKLDGRHAPLSCDACHPKIQLAPGVKSALYKPRPVSCEGCHSDFHRGAFKGFAP